MIRPHWASIRDWLIDPKCPVEGCGAKPGNLEAHYQAAHTDPIDRRWWMR